MVVTDHRLHQILRPYRRRLLTLSSLSVASGFFEAAFLVGVVRIALAVANSAPKVEITRGLDISPGVALSLLGGAILSRLLLLLTVAKIQTSLIFDLGVSSRKNSIKWFLGQSWSNQQQVGAGQFLQLTLDYSDRISSVGGKVSTLLATSANLAILFLISFIVDWRASLAVTALLSLLLSVLRPIRSRIALLSARSIAEKDQLAEALAENHRSALEIRVLGVTEEATTRAFRLVTKLGKATRRLNLRVTVQPQIYISAAYGALVVLLAVSQGVDGANLNSVGAVTLIMMRLLSYGQSLQSTTTALQELTPYITAIQDLQTEGSLPHQESSRLIETAGPLTLSFDKVHFHYPGANSLIRGLSFQVAPGSSAALVGPSGAGKTTVLRLALRLIKPTEGRIAINQIPLENINETQLRELVALVPQESRLIRGSILENVRFFRNEVTENQVVQALHDAGLWNEVERLPGGIMAQIGADGQGLSGGQRQRLTVARSLAANPRILIMDEPTSSLDQESSEVIHQTIRSLRGRMTILVVAHRQETIEACDQIIRIG